jgi:hypothetical protein
MASADIHTLARNGTRADLEQQFETLRSECSDAEDFQESLQAFINTRNEQKYSPLHCAIFSR